MRRTALASAALSLTFLATPLVVASPASAAKPTAQSAHCASLATDHKLTGAERTTFIKTCVKGPMHPVTATKPTAVSKEAQAVTKPSGVDRNTRAAQCAAEADRKGLTSKDRKGFQLSCQATAGPVTEGQNGTKTPAPAHEIKGIGENNYKPDAAPAKSAPVKK